MKNVQGLGQIDNAWKTKLNVVEGGALYQSMIHRLTNSFKAKYAES